MALSEAKKGLLAPLAAAVASTDDAVLSTTLHGIIQSVADGITVQERSGQVVYANAAAARLVGYPSAEALVHAPLGEAAQRFQVFDAAGQPFPMTELPGQRVLRGEQAGEVLLRFQEIATGADRWAIVRALPALDAAGNVLLAVNTFHDMTQVMRGEQALRYLLQASQLLTGSLDYETTLQTLAHLVVPEFADWCTVHVREADGSVRQLAVAHVDPAKVVWAEALAERYPPSPDAQAGYPKVLRTGRSELISEFPDEMLVAAAPDAEALALARGLGLSSSMCVPLRVGERTLGALTFVAAESGRRYGQDDLVLAEELARRAAAAIDNAQLYRSAQQALQVRDAFLGTISHDLRTPLATIQAVVQLCMRQARRIGSPETERLAERLNMATGAVAKMTGMIGELLDLTRLQSNAALDLQRQPIDLVALVERQVAEQQASAPRHRLRVEASQPGLMGRWDGQRLERVIGNLLSNAVKYSPNQESIVITVSQETADAQPWAIVTVEDHGLGIPAGDLPHLFERFYRASNVAGRVPGVGLGLVAARQIVEQHGGTLSISSENGVGTTVTLRLPCEPAAAAEEQR
jgi:signal transduction histidine kinase